MNLNSRKSSHKSLALPISAPVRDAVAVIERGGAKVAMVTDLDRLVGVVTDGDVRRGLLSGESLDSPVANIMQRNFRSLPLGATASEAMSVMRREVLNQIPVLDENGKVAHLFLLEDLIRPKKLPNLVVVMAGGEGKRLRPLTSACPKPMLKVAGKPLLEIILEQCLDAGFENFFFSVNYLKDQIKSHFQDGSSWGCCIHYLEEEKPLGTAGALSLLPQRPEEPFLVINGDVLTRVDYANLLRFHVDHKSTATVGVREHYTQIPFGVVRMRDAKVMAIEEKPVLNHHVNAGIYLMNPDVLELIPRDMAYDMPQLLKSIMQRTATVSAFPIHEYWLDIGRPENLERAHGEW